MRLVRRYWLAGLIALLGAALTFYVGFRSGSTVGVIWSGATVGILTGIAIGAARPREPSARRKR
jgi:uncharacterized membrane protein YhhN